MQFIQKAFLHKKQEADIVPADRINPLTADRKVYLDLDDKSLLHEPLECFLPEYQESEDSEAAPQEKAQPSLPKVYLPRVEYVAP